MQVSSNRLRTNGHSVTTAEPNDFRRDVADAGHANHVRYPHATENQGIANLSQDEEPGAVQLLLGRTKLECTVRYLGIEVDDALEMAEQTDV